MADPTDDNVALVIEAMYRFAADPEAWEQLIEVLDEEGEDPPPAAARDLAHSEDIARLVSRPDEGPGARRGRDDVGWVVLAATRKVIAANAAAAAVVADGLGRLEIGREIAFDDPTNAEALRRALDQARAQAPGQTILKLEHEGEEGPRYAYVVPAGALPGVVDEAALDPSEEGQAVAVVFPAVAETGRLWASIRESFGLTPAEIRLAAKLRDGRALKEAADELDVSINTVRNQLRAIFDKMGLKRQSELVRALTELAAVASAIDTQGAGPGVGGASQDTPPVLAVILPDGRRLAYRDYGDPEGRAILSFHEGLGSSLLPPGTQALARRLGLRIVSAERPGFGQSDPHPDYSFATVAEDMVALCDKLGLGEVRIGAVLSGAPSAVETAIRLGPRAVEVHLFSGRPPRPVQARANPLTQFRARIESNPWVLETLFAILRQRISPSLVTRILRRSSVHAPADRAYIEAYPRSVEFIAAYVSEALARTSRGPADEVRAFRRARNATAEGLRARLVVWHGEQDVFAPLSDLLAYLGDRATEVRVKPAIGHLLALKHWEEILRDVAA
jgi:pimeloyl-ACP methyl ester carboxylesterase/DNA-binding CsgD family transcriptional regulator